MTQRRDNGLSAERYVPIAQVRPVAADDVLETLRRSGIAGYVVTTAEPAGPAVSTADAAGERLFVDADEQVRAEEVLRDELSDWREPSATDPPDTADGLVDVAEDDPTGRDTAWDELVARFYESEGSPSAPTWPDAENVARGAVPTPDDDPDGNTATIPEEGDGRSGERRRPVSEEEDHYIPPPPPPIPSGDAVSRMSWTGLLGGPALLLIMTLLGMRVPGWLALLAVAGFIGGFVVLVIRMGDRPPRDSGPDDGAVV